MRKVLLISVLLAFVLGACDDNSEGTNTIAEADLTEREDAILSTTAEQSFVFDFNVDEEYEEFSLWVERYESGELVDDQLIFLTAEIHEEGSVIFAVSGKNDAGIQLFLHTGISSDGGVAMSRNETTLPGENLSSIWGSNPNEMGPDEGEMVLASILYSSDENEMSSLPAEFYEDMNGHIEELEEYDVALLVKGEFVE